MKNNITVSVEFYFKGEKLSPSMVVNLDENLKLMRDPDLLYSMLASSNGIDRFSYEYEMMLSDKFIFSNATGLAEAFLKEGEFDLAAFEQALDEQSISDVISKIASEHLSIDDLSSQPNLKLALFEAFKQGRRSD